MELGRTLLANFIRLKLKIKLLTKDVDKVSNFKTSCGILI